MVSAINKLSSFYQLFAQTDKVLSCYAMGINQSTSGVDKCQSIINAHLATGKILRAGCGPFSLTGQPNAMGGREVGGLANQLACHMDIENPSHQALVQEFWQSPTIATQQGLKAVDLFDSIAQGKIKAVWIMATNPVVSLPDRKAIENALAACELVVVSDCTAHTDTMSYADIKLPATTWLEKNGTVTNSERTISRQRAAVSPLGHAKHDWQIICDVAKAMDFNGFDYTTVNEVFTEFAALSGYKNNGKRQFDISGLSHLTAHEYNALLPVQWPVCQRNNGEVFTDKLFSTGSRKAQFYTITPQLPVQQSCSDYPYTLNSGRLRDHWHTMTRTGKAATLNKHTDKPYVYLSEQDAQQLSVVNGDMVEVVSRQGKMIAAVDIDSGLQPKQLFAAIHWNDQFATNASVACLYQSSVDPLSGQPELKQAAVNIKKIDYQHYVEMYVANDIPIEQGYWNKLKLDHSTGIQLALTSSISHPVHFCQQLVPTKGEWMSFNSENGCQVICTENERLTLVAYFSLKTITTRSTWIDPYFAESKLNFSHLKQLLDKKQSNQMTSRQICSCFSVNEHQVIQCIEQGNDSVSALASQLKCGTGCGSCKPELQILVNQHKQFKQHESANYVAYAAN